MPPKISTANRGEAVRTRNSSKKEKNVSSSPDIVQAIKMAAEKEKNNLIVNASVKSAESTSATSLKGKELSTKQQITEEHNAPEQTQFSSQTTTSENNQHVSFTMFKTFKEEILEAVRELTEKFATINKALYNADTGLNTQMVGLTLKSDNLHSDIHGVTDGILAKIRNFEELHTGYEAKMEHLEQTQKRMANLLAENKKMAGDLLTAQGLLQRYSQKIRTMEGKILDLTRRGMEQNVVIHGLEEKPKPNEEDCFATVLEFTDKFLGINLDEADVWKVYRFGKLRKDRARPMFVKLSYYGKDNVMDHVSALKGRKNHHGQSYFVSEQVPEGIVENRKQIAQRVGVLKAKEAKKPPTQQQEVRIMGEKIVVGGNVDRPLVSTPQPNELFPSMEEQSKINGLNSKIKETLPSYEKNSSFVGLAVETKSIEEVNLAYKAVVQRYPYMDHVMMGYRVTTPDGEILHGGCDDTEYGGGSCVENQLYAMKQNNIATFVVRRYGGIHLGVDRFQTIRAMTSMAVKILRPQDFDLAGELQEAAARLPATPSSP